MPQDGFNSILAGVMLGFLTIFFLIVHRILVSMYEYVCMSAGVHGGLKKVLCQPELELQTVGSHPGWVLELKLLPSAREGCFLNCWATSPGPSLNLL